MRTLPEAGLVDQVPVRWRCRGDAITGQGPQRHGQASSVHSFELSNNRARSAAQDSYLGVRNEGAAAREETVL